MARLMVARLASSAKESAICLEDTPGCSFINDKTIFLSIVVVLNQLTNIQESAQIHKDLSRFLMSFEPIP